VVTHPMDFTGERIIPGLADINPLFEEHLARYFFAGKFAQGRSILDLGCGTGYGSYYLSERGPRFVVGTDIAAEAIQYACLQYNAPNLVFAQCDAVRLPFRSQAIDLVVSFEVIEHLQPVKSYLTEISRVLTDEGWLIGSTPNKLVYSLGADQPHNPFHYLEYDPPELHFLLAEIFGAVVILGQRPFYGSVIGPVSADTIETAPMVEFLPQDTRLENSIADSKYLLYFASKSATQIDEFKKHLISTYYLGQPASYHDAATGAHIRHLENEKDRLESLVRGYQSGKFIRFMNLVHSWKSRLFGG
jgi:SAM-dependent methyltransferase